MNRIRLHPFMAVVVILATVPAAARGEFRHTLLIGQSAYNSGTLATRRRDVVADALGRAGFSVKKAENLSTVNRPLRLNTGRVISPLFRDV